MPTYRAKTSLETVYCLKANVRDATEGKALNRNAGLEAFEMYYACR
jgi:hypothetical protein